MRIVLATTGQPSTNPRLVKEANALVEAGYSVKVYYSYWADWAADTDRQLLETVKWEYELIGGAPYTDQITFILNKITFKFYQKISKYFNLSLAKSRNKTFDRLVKILKEEKANHYIAHNLGALVPIALAAKHNQSSFSFDAEDFHRGQYSQTCRDQDIEIRLENEYLPKARFVTTASSLITKHYQDLYPNQKFTTINNVFSKKEFKNTTLANNTDPLKLFWFSQTIGTNRGIEDVIEAIGLCSSNDIKLTLLGSISSENFSYFRKIVKEFGLQDHQFEIISPVSPKEIFEIAKYHDIGLALEPAFNLNNDLALSNKIFTYLSVGLTVIASETQAQRLFFEENSDIGITYCIGDVISLSKIIQGFIDDKKLLKQYKRNAYTIAETRFNWELECKKFISLINETFSK
ncbi:glycosyltransferase family protein [Pedobacter xixiisoli]|uniref:Glycosyltransferase involved in cell wall bisynthesis n=1 Tax=Pedobacter xixiisoli TaxID=1476464 RepID=A0A286A9N0_9SPHI|nr:hypothetical protein [Pedobacter xixiisoli]SOD18616.1 Glycosyltransferase involved in cell wall bisynthesis [Pedobacter xixiisoli]